MTGEEVDGRRFAAVECARCDVGMVARPGAGALRFEARIRAPGYAAPCKSTCATWAGRGYLASVLARPWGPWVEPYRDQHAVSDLVEGARHAQAIRLPASGEFPQPGDVVLDGPHGTAGAHVWVVSRVEVVGDTIRASGVEGGQRVDGWQAVLERERVLSTSIDRLFDVVSAGPIRPIVEWYDLQALWEAYGWAL